MACSRKHIDRGDILQRISMSLKTQNIPCQGSGITRDIDNSIGLHRGYCLNRVLAHSFPRRIDDNDLRAEIPRGKGPGGLSGVAAEKFQTAPSEGARHKVTPINHVGFEIHPRHLNGSTENVGKIMVGGKGKIAFAATQVANTQLSRRGKCGQAIADQFQKSVDLTEFGLLFIVDAPVRVADVEQPQKRLVPLQNVRLAAIVGGNLHARGRLGRKRTGQLFAAEQGLFARFGRSELASTHCGNQVDLTMHRDQLTQTVGIFGQDVFMNGFAVGAKGLGLKNGLAAHRSRGHDRADLGFVGTATKDREISFMPFCRDELVLITPNNDRYRELKEKKLNLTWIEQEPWIMREDGSGTYKETLHVFEEMGIHSDQLHILARFNNTGAILLSVAQGSGISIVSRLAAQAAVERGDVLDHPLGANGSYRWISIATSSTTPLTDTSRDMIKLVKKMYSC